MRIGTNPLKKNILTLEHKKHRVILPFWIPNTTDNYFRNQPDVLRWCLKSLTETIDPSQTNITLINNNSCAGASAVAQEFVDKGMIDKYVVRNQNRGKLENVLAEARASYEDFVTICDADFLFFHGWENAVAEIMNAFPQAGMVTCFPAAHLAYSFNSNMLGTSFRQGKVVEDKDIDDFEIGIGHAVDAGLYSRPGIKRKFPWRKCQYYVRNGNVTAVLGAVHALATYRRQVVDAFNARHVEHVFRNGYEHDYIDFAAERQGYLRLSSPSGYAYHMGNTVPEHKIETFALGVQSPEKIIPWSSSHRTIKVKVARLLWPFTQLAFRFLRKCRFL
ncbi:MAG: glycosyltransferase family A protein [Breznakibacter sp.]